MKFHVTANRTVFYEIEADNESDAIDGMIDGDAKEVGGETTSIEAEALCPTCDMPMREVQADEGDAYECRSCKSTIPKPDEVEDAPL